jgi:predicted membrane protein
MSKSNRAKLIALGILLGIVAIPVVIHAPTDRLDQVLELVRWLEALIMIGIGADSWRRFGADCDDKD